MEIVANSQSEAYVKVLRALDVAPEVSPRGKLVKEIPERLSVRIKYPQMGFVKVHGRALNYAILAIEGTSLVGQTSVPELLLDRVGAFAPYANDGIFWGAYGPRIAGDLGHAVEVLKRDPDSRQAVLSLFDSGRDLYRPGVVDVPCTVAIQFFVRSAKLDMWVVMRSNDAWLGLPYDLGQFSLLQFAVAQALGIEVGEYTHSAGSMHLYEEHWIKAKQVLGPSTGYEGYKYNSASISGIASRCRRILLGQDVDEPTSLEMWLGKQIALRIK